jgi:uridine kinase
MHFINVRIMLYVAVDMAKIKMDEYNFDHPHALDFDMAYQVLGDLLRGQKTSLPKYCFVTPARLNETEEIIPT